VYDLLNWANRITLFRLVSTPVFVGLLLHYREQIRQGLPPKEINYILWLALALFIIATISDGLDGLIARVYEQKTLLGTLLDPVADKLLLMTSTIILSLPMGLKYQIPSWLTVTIISRDIIILAGAMVVYLLIGKTRFIPSYLGKITTFLQMSTILFVLIQAQICNILFYMTFIFTILSGLYYIYRETRFANLSNGSHENKK